MSGGAVGVEREKPTPKARVRVLDTLRGFSILSMVLYHGMFDLVYMFGVDLPWYRGWPGYLWQQSICWVFILVSGASLHYGRHTLKRGLVVLGCGLLVSLVTAVGMPSQAIWFGILHFMGAAMLLSLPLRPLLKKVPVWGGAAACFALFLFTKGVPYGFLGIADHPLLTLPEVLYSTPFLFPLGLQNAAFSSGDYFPLIPWFFLFLTGWFIWAGLKDKAPRSTKRPGPLGFLGRHSLLIYMLHQPVLYGLFWLLNLAGVFS
ncbi:DUF1624 domain-containing protein [Ruminococcaceae bacterium OttesenSCG-928-I18]|nr:DUF1624 domain-containing protein [Ruminococcaceae bacterium OttesenSCG-928-I18]